MFVDREDELAFLRTQITQRRAGRGNLILLYGRRRVGKSALLLHWAAQSKLGFTYWAAEKELAPLQRRKLYARLLDVPFSQTPTFATWDDLWRAMAKWLKDQAHILILDELPYAAEADPAMLSSLQHAWDQQFKNSNLTIVLCGSQVRTMETLFTRQSPLFGRMTGQWHLQALPFSSLKEFFPNWTAVERVTAYALVGGIAAYLEWLDPQRSVMKNIEEVVLARGGMFVAEPSFLLYDEVREPKSYLSVLKAIGSGNHTLEEISNACLIGKDHLSAYLTRLQELHLVERRLPALVKPAERNRSRRGRYHLNDAYFRFYFRFIAPEHNRLPFDVEPVLRRVQSELTAFVGQTAFEELARAWIVKQGKDGRLSCNPDIVGSHWNRHVQADVVALNWQERKIIIGECKWGEDEVGQQIAQELIDVKVPKVVADLPEEGKGWKVQIALFARAGFTAAARTLIRAHQGLLVDLQMLDREL